VHHLAAMFIPDQAHGILCAFGNDPVDHALSGIVDDEAFSVGVQNLFNSLLTTERQCRWSAVPRLF
jgi:hypothetical protein